MLKVTIQLQIEELKVFEAELKENIKEFTALELEATNDRLKFKYSMRMAMAKDNLKEVQDMIEHLETLECKICAMCDDKEIDEILEKDMEDVTPEDIAKVLTHVVREFLND